MSKKEFEEQVVIPMIKKELKKMRESNSNINEIEQIIKMLNLKGEVTVKEDEE
ncbi:MAG: hypothetical protein ACRDDY_17085 [Clostridium sp.]|uniref:hypothetical protein n=1 Tax=Clostridium sp. TaxID=1506 RepID=UPI003EE50282